MLLVVKKSSLEKTILVCFFSTIVFLRFVYVGEVFSYDYDAYLLIIQKLTELPIADMVGANFAFPYVIAQGITPIELGFSILVKTLGVLIDNPAITYALIAAISVGLRVYVMRSMGVPLIWIVILNVIAITLFEANAIRLGAAVSVLMLGLYWLLARGRLRGYMAITLSVTLHLQIVLFIFPLFAFFFLYPWLRASKVRLFLVLAASVLGCFAFTKILPSISNPKVQEYVSRGNSDSAGLTALSLASILLVICCVLTVCRNSLENEATKLWAATLTAFICSVVLLVSLTSVAVIGIRTWQVAFILMSTFIFNERKASRKIDSSFILLVIVTAILFVNVTVRYPVSNVVSPPFPGISLSNQLLPLTEPCMYKMLASTECIKYHRYETLAFSKNMSGAKLRPAAFIERQETIG